MRIALPLVLALLLIFPAYAAEDRAAKRALIDELLETMDSKAMIQTSLDQLFDAMQQTRMTPLDDEEMDEETRADFEKAQSAELERMRSFRERLYTRIDYVKYAEEVYVPIFDEHFTSDELKQLIEFSKTRVGQNFVGAMSELGIGAMMKGTELMQEAASQTMEELEREDRAKHPWKATMADMRSIATAVEARATDTNDYPDVDFSELATLVAPTYIREVPQKDVWGTPFLYIGTGENYRIVSAGADKRFDWNARQMDPNAVPTPSESLDTDLIFQDGTFIQYPKEADLDY